MNNPGSRTMHRLALALLLVTASAFLSAGTAAAQPPYTILRGPAHEQWSPPKSAVAPVKIVTPTPYAYGWFGARPHHRHRARSHGYYNAWTQWSFR